MNKKSASQSATELQKIFEHNGSADIGVVNEFNILRFLNNLQKKTWRPLQYFFTSVPLESSLSTFHIMN